MRVILFFKKHDGFCSQKIMFLNSLPKFEQKMISELTMLDAVSNESPGDSLGRNGHGPPEGRDEGREETERRALPLADSTL